MGVIQVRNESLEEAMQRGPGFGRVMVQRKGKKEVYRLITVRKERFDALDDRVVEWICGWVEAKLLKFCGKHGEVLRGRRYCMIAAVS